MPFVPGHVRVSQVVLEILVPTVGGPVQPLNLTCGGPPQGQIGVLYTHAFPATGGTPPYVFSLVSGAFPPGLTLNTATGVLSGIPTAAGSYTFTIRVVDSVANAVQVTCGFVVVGLPVTITLRGVNRRAAICKDLQLGDVPRAPSVTRAM